CVAPVVGSIECKFPVAQFPYGTTGFPDPQDLAGQTMIPYGICDLKVCGAVAGGACDANNNNCCPSGTTPTFAGPAINQTCTCVVPTPPPGPTCALFQGSCSPSVGAADVAQTCCAAQNLACDISLNQCLGGLNYICQTGSDCATGYICNSSQKCEPTGCNLNLTPIAPTQACSPTANGACCASVTATEATIANPETHYVCGLSSATVGQAGYNTHVCCVEGGLNNASNNTYVQSAAECCQGSVYTAVPATNGYICVNANNPAPLPTPLPAGAPAPAHGMSSGLTWGLIGGATALVATGIMGYYITRRNGQLDLVAERDAYNKDFGNMLLDGRTVAEYAAAQQSGGRGVAVDPEVVNSLRLSFKRMCSTGPQFSAELLAVPHSLSLGATAGGDNCPNADEDLSVAVTVAPDGTQTVGAAGPIPAEVLAVIDNSGGGSGGAPSFTAATAGLYDGVLEQLKANSNFFNSDGTPKFSIAKVGNGVPGEDILLADTDHLMLKACEIDGLLNPGKTPGVIIADLASATDIFDAGDIALLASAGGNTPAARAIGQAIATKGVGRMITLPANLKFAITLADLAKTPALAAQIAALQTEFDASFEEAYWTLMQNLTDGAGHSLIPDPTVADFPPAGFTDLPDLD
ncbi:MAG TPA: hypothetical protein VJJ83_00180, partial [Candidatus Babeliales bacterium]|nr:hypothetical protein [Candidatus Babeliales bacterium]